MFEDTQPNERALSRKGAAIPMVRPVTGKTSFSAGAGSHYPASSYFRRPGTTSNYHKSGAYDSSQQQHRRRNYSHDTWQAKRRRLERDWGAGHAGHKPTPSTPTAYPKARKNRKPEATELLVDVPPECRKGAPGCQKLRKQWIALQIKEIQTSIGVKVQFCGYLENSARFTCTNAQPPIATVINSGLHLPVDVGFQPDASMQDEIIISGHLLDVDAELDEVVHERFPHSADGEPFVVSVDGQGVEIDDSLPALHPAEDTTVLPPSATEIVEPLRVFSSGVLSFCPPTHTVRSPSPEAPIVPVETESMLDLTAVDCGIPRANHRSAIDTISVSGRRTQELATNSLHTSGVSQIPITHLFNYEPQHTNTVLCLKQFSQQRIREIMADGTPIQVPTRQYDKFRRLLSLATIPSVLNVSMRGSINLVDVVPLRHRRTLKATNLPGGLIDDACLLQAGNDCLAILGHAEEQEQLSWCRFQVNENQLSDACPLPRPWNTSKKGGVSAVTSMLQPLQFATGGYDHVIHLWEVKADFSAASPRQLVIKHSSQIQSLLAVCDTSHKLISAAADCNVHFWDLSSERVVSTVKTSNTPYHAHLTASPFCTLLEVAHRELQFEIRDHRFFPERPVQRFGYTTAKLHGRFIKGDIMSDIFACGGCDGFVRLWDMRNLKAIPASLECGSGQKITQVLLDQSRLIACSQNGQMRLFRHDI